MAAHPQPLSFLINQLKVSDWTVQRQLGKQPTGQKSVRQQSKTTFMKNSPKSCVIHLQFLDLPYQSLMYDLWSFQGYI